MSKDDYGNAAASLCGLNDINNGVHCNCITMSNGTIAVLGVALLGNSNIAKGIELHSSLRSRDANIGKSAKLLDEKSHYRNI